MLAGADHAAAVVGQQDRVKVGASLPTHSAQAAAAARGRVARSSSRMTCCRPCSPPVKPSARMRVLVEVLTSPERTRPRSSTPPSRNLASSRAPAASQPTTPTMVACEPRPRMLAAGLAAEPARSSLSTTSTIGTGASREMRVMRPVTYSSSTRSPTTRMRRPASLATSSESVLNAPASRPAARRSAARRSSARTASATRRGDGEVQWHALVQQQRRPRPPSTPRTDTPRRSAPASGTRLRLAPTDTTSPTPKPSAA